MWNLVIVGASVRAAAASAVRAGFAPWCIDLFGDCDLARECRVDVAVDYPRGLFDLLKSAPSAPWMYTGGLENFPDLLETTSRELWGNSPDIVRTVRDPQRLAALFETAPRLTSQMVERRWLVKPRFSSSGREVRWWRGEGVGADDYLQEWMPGVPASAAFVGRHGQAHLLGATRQLIGCPWLHAERPFQYAGSIGPLACSDSRLREMGQRVVNAFDLRGLFGIDFILDGEQLRPVEVNPRYPASLEILERFTGEPMLARHAAAFGGTTDVQPKRVTPQCHGKAILFAADDLVVPHRAPWWPALAHRLGDFDVPFADIPPARQQIRRGDPVVTFFAEADSDSECEARLRKIAGDLDRALWGR